MYISRGRHWVGRFAEFQQQLLFLAASVAALRVARGVFNVGCMEVVANSAHAEAKPLSLPALKRSPSRRAAEAEKVRFFPCTGCHEEQCLSF